MEGFALQHFSPLQALLPLFERVGGSWFRKTFINPRKSERSSIEERFAESETRSEDKMKTGRNIGYDTKFQKLSLLGELYNEVIYIALNLPLHSLEI